MRLKTKAMNDTLLEAAVPTALGDSRRGVSTPRRVRQLEAVVEGLPNRLGNPDVGSQRSRPSPLTQGLAKGIDTRECHNGQLDCDAIAWVAASRGISSDRPARNCREGTNPNAWQGIREVWEGEMSGGLQ